MSMKSPSITMLLVIITKTIFKPISKTSKCSIIKTQVEEEIEEKGEANKNPIKTTHDSTLKIKHIK